MDPILENNNSLQPFHNNENEQLVAARKEWYKNLPRVKTDPVLAEKVLKFFKKLLQDVCFPLHMFRAVFSLYPKNVLNTLTIAPGSISPLAQKRFMEITEKIRQIAQKTGIEKPENVSFLLLKHLGASPAAAGVSFTQPIVLTSPEWLVQPEDLPEELRLENLKTNKISEDEWIERFEVWIWKDFLKIEKPADADKKSQLKVDRQRLGIKVWLHNLHNPKKFSDMFKLIVGHECGHLHHAHSLIRNLTRIAWSIVCFASLGLLSPLTKKVMNIFSRIHEKEADLFGAKKTGKALAGAKFFEHVRDLMKARRHKYPELQSRITEAGDSPDCTHPTNSERIAFFRTFAAASVA